VPATWHEIATTNSAAFPNDVGIGTGGSIGRRQLKAITQLAACSPGEYGARPRTLVSLLHRQLPDSATHTVPGAGHAAWSGAPGAFAEIASCPTTQATPAQPAPGGVPAHATLRLPSRSACGRASQTPRGPRTAPVLPRSRGDRGVRCDWH